MSIENLINDLKKGDNVSANKNFGGIMADKISAGLDAKKIEIASTLVSRRSGETSEEEESLED